MVNTVGLREDFLPQAVTVSWVRGLNNGAGEDSARISPTDLAGQLSDLMYVILPDGTVGLLADVLQTIKSQAASGLTGVGTYANLLAITPQPPTGTLVQVGNDPDPNKNGTYRKDPAGPDGWMKTADRTDQLRTEVDNHEARLDTAEAFTIPAAQSTLYPTSTVWDPNYPFGKVKVIFGVGDATYNQTLWQNEKGEIYANGLRIESTTEAHPYYKTGAYYDGGYDIWGFSKYAGFVAAGVAEFMKVPGDDGFVIVNEDFMSIARDISYPDEDIPLIGGGSGTSPTGSAREFYRSKLAFRLLYGQSLSLGTFPPGYAGVKLITGLSAYGNLMLSGGLRSETPSTDTLVTCQEVIYDSPTSDYDQGETGHTASGDRLLERIAATDGVAIGAAEMRFVNSAVGIGGTRISLLGPGSVTFERAIAHAQRVADLATASGQSSSCRTIIWRQGESDQNITSRGTYKGLFTTCKDSFISRMRTVFHQDWDPIFITYQLASHNAYGSVLPAIGLALRDVVLTPFSNVAFSAPCYIFNFTDQIHLDAESYRMLGYYEARAEKWIEDQIALGESDPKGCALDIAHVHWRDEVIDITYNVQPGQKLEVDTTWVASAANKGFTRRLDADPWTPVAGGITSVNVVSRDTVRVIPSSPMAANEFLSFGWGAANGASGRTANPAGNIRDDMGFNTGESYTDGVGTTRYLHNWAMIAEIRRP